MDEKVLGEIQKGSVVLIQFPKETSREGLADMVNDAYSQLKKKFGTEDYKQLPLVLAVPNTTELKITDRRKVVMMLDDMKKKLEED